MSNYKLRNTRPAAMLLIFIFILVIRIPSLNNSPYEYHAWRQSDTEAIARNFVEQRFNIFYPQLNYDGPPPNYVQLEFQITTFLIAILYKLFGYHYYLARLVPLLFFMGSACYLFFIGKKIYSLRAAWFTVILYGIFPLNIFISRAIMPESAALFFYTGAFYYFLEWKDTDNVLTLSLAALFTALAVATKVPAVFIGIPMLYVSWQKYGTRLFSSLQLWSFAAVSLGLPFIYYAWLHNIAQTDYVTGIAVGQILPNLFQAVFTPEARSFLITSLPGSYTAPGLLLALAGLFTARDLQEFPLLVWGFALLLQVITVVSAIRLDYYLVFLGPLLALLGARFLQHLTGAKAGPAVILFIFLIMLFAGWNNTSMDYQEKGNLFRYAEIIKKNTTPDDLVVIGSAEPLLLNCSSRKGWRINTSFFRNPRDEVNYFIANGARYFFPFNETPYPDYNDYIKYLETTYKRITVQDGYDYYILE